MKKSTIWYVITDGGRARFVARDELARLSEHPPDAYAATKADLRGPLVDASQNERRFAEILPIWKSPRLRARAAAILKR